MKLNKIFIIMALCILLTFMLSGCTQKGIAYNDASIVNIVDINGFAHAIVLNDLNDVFINGVTNGQFLGYNASINQWVPFDINGGIVFTAACPAGQVLQLVDTNGTFICVPNGTGGGSFDANMVKFVYDDSNLVSVGGQARILYASDGSTPTIKWNDLNLEGNWLRNGYEICDASGNCGTVIDTNWQTSWATFDANMKATYITSSGEDLNKVMSRGNNTQYDLNIYKSSALIQATNTGGNAKTISLLADNSTDASYIKVNTGVPAGNPIGVQGTSLAATTGTFSDFDQNKFSWFGWIKTTDATSVRIQPFSFGSFASSGTMSLQIFNGVMYLYGYNPSITAHSAFTNINDGSWHFIGFTYDNGNVVLYKDSTSSSGTIASGIGKTAKQLSFLNNTGAATHDEHGLWNRILTAGEISSLYNSGNGLYGSSTTSPHNSGLVAGWHFEENTGTTGAAWNDASKNYSFSSVTWGVGKVPSPPSDSIVNVLTVSDGISASAQGTIVLGNNTSDTTFNGGVLNFQTNGTNKVKIFNDGNFLINTNTFFVDALNNKVGIGTIIPQNKLQVIGDTNIDNNLIVDGSTLFVNSVSNRIGVGTTVPSSPLHVYSAGGSSMGLIVEGTTANLYSEIQAKGSAGFTSLNHTGNTYSNGGWGNNEGIIGSSANAINISGWNSGTYIKFHTGGFATTNERMRITADGNISVANRLLIGAGYGVYNPTAKLQIAAGSTAAGTSPLKFTSGNLLSTTEVGAIEFLTDDYYATITTGAGGSVSYYPPAQTGVYVKADSYYSTDYYPYYATDPTKSLIGTGQGNSWVSANVATPNVLQIDLGSAKSINRIYYENLHVSGGTTNAGVKDFTLWGSNDVNFSDTNASRDTNWTQITAGLSATQFSQHIALNQPDPQYITMTITAPYRYYRVKFTSDWGFNTRRGIERIELQDTTRTDTGRQKIVLTNSQAGLTSGRIPYTTTNGRLTDANTLTTNGQDVNISRDLRVDGNTYLRIPYGTYTSTKTQTVGSTGVKYYMDFNTTEDVYMVQKYGDTNFGVTVTGDYMINISIVATSSVAGKRINIWFEKNGVAVPRSNTPYDFKTTNAIAIISVPFIIDLNTTDRFSIMYSADSTNVTLPYIASDGVAPETPSSIMTIYKIGEDMG